MNLFFSIRVFVGLWLWLAILALTADDWPTRSLKKQPNLVMIFIDDMGWGDFSCFGNQQAQTPNIDRLAKAGIRFEQFWRAKKTKRAGSIRTTTSPASSAVLGFQFLVFGLVL